MSYAMPDAMVEQYRQMLGKGFFTGRTTLLFAEKIRTLCRAFGAKTLLDYGCGRGDQYDVAKVHEDWGVAVTCYDPAVLDHMKRPDGKFDGVICVDVLEHVEEKDLPAVIDDVCGHADRFVYFTVCTRPAKKNLPDGRNCHLTIRPQDWWLDLLAKQVPPRLYYEVDWNA